GNILYYEGTIEDITERKLAENNLRESEKRLTELNATKDKFFSIIAHDLRSPFNSIIGFGNLLLEQIQEKKYQDLEKYIQIILKSSNNAMDLLLNLLEWARSQTGGMEFKLAPVDITLIINEVAGQMDPIAQEKSITISSDLS
ncbi:MAG: PAS domain-containing sensor histidine kinase, partial [Bacteroidetes bacterium CG_4_9_14_3_um_filter_41_19]